MLIYRINGNLNGNADGPPDEVYVYRPGGTTTDNGNLTAAIFSAATGRTEINDFTSPSSFLHGGVPGGLNITDIGYPGETIEFTCHIDCLNNIDGDINGDDGVDILDIILMVNSILVTDFDSCSDLNSDGIVNILDIILIINIILEG